MPIAVIMKCITYILFLVEGIHRFGYICSSFEFIEKIIFTVFLIYFYNYLPFFRKCFRSVTGIYLYSVENEK